MKKITYLIVSASLFVGLSLSFSSSALAQQTAPPIDVEQPEIIPPSDTQALPPQLYPPVDYFTAIVEEIVEQGEDETLGVKQKFQVVTLKIASGKEYGNIITLRQEGDANVNDHQFVRSGEKVVVVMTSGGGENGGAGFYIADKYRLPPMFFAIILFLALVIYFGRLKGFMSMLGLAFSIFVLLKFVVPMILAGHSPLLITLVGSFLIAVVSIFLAHGFNKRTVISVVSTLMTLTIAIGLSVLFVEIAQLFGNGSEEALYLRLDPATNVNLQGLLLGGIIIGTLGVLDDITTAQVAVVDELKSANRSFGATELYRRGLAVGREHIASLVNTLVLAYAGASLPLFLMFTLNTAQPFWVTFNSEFIAEEVIRTLVGSIALILAVPISTWMAARYVSRRRGL